MFSQVLHPNSNTTIQHNIDDLLCAPTGKAEFHINGMTLYSAFALPLNQNVGETMPLSGILKLRIPQLINIDELSLVESKFFIKLT